MLVLDHDVVHHDGVLWGHEMDHLMDGVEQR